MKRSFQRTAFAITTIAGFLGGCELVAGVGDLSNRDDREPLIDSASTDGPTSNESSSDAPVDSPVGDGGVEAATLPPSCKAGTVGVTSCAGEQGCCTSPLVTGGTFFRTYSYNFAGLTGTSDPATISSFRLDKYEVTVGRFRNFLKTITAVDGGPPAEGSGKHAHLNSGKGLANDELVDGGFETGWDSADWNFGLPSGAGSMATWETNLSMGGTWSLGNDALPIAGVAWFEAMAFCIWDGGFLPSDSEFEYAMAGGDSQRLYPWGPTVPDSTCPGGCDYDIFGCVYPSPADASSCAATNIAPVGTATKGVGRYGQVDLFGNAIEWVFDRANEDIATPQKNPCTDCANAGTNVQRGSGRYVRGGDFASPIPAVDFRDDVPPNYRTGLQPIGFRCARPPTP